MTTVVVIMGWAVLQVNQLEPDKCYQVDVTAVNEKGKSTSVSTNITCADKNEALVSVEGTYSIILNV